MVVNNISNCCCGQERPFRERNARCQLPGESIKDIWLLYVNISSVRNTASGWYYYYCGTVPHLLTNTLSSLRCLKWNEPGNFARFGNVASTLPPTALPPTTTQLPNARRTRQGYKLWGLSPYGPSLADPCLTLAWASQLKLYLHYNRTPCNIPDLNITLQRVFVTISDNHC